MVTKASTTMNNEVIIVVGPANYSDREGKEDDDSSDEDDAEREPIPALVAENTSDGSPTKISSSLRRMLTTTASALPKHKSRIKRDEKVIGLKHYGLDNPVRHQLHDSSFEVSLRHGTNETSEVRFAVEAKEEEVRRLETRNPFAIFYLGNLAALKVVTYYLITLETVVSCIATVLLTIYWYNAYPDDHKWNGRILDFVLVAFALTAPITAALTMSFSRRERALMWTADFRSWSYHLYLAHCLWDWEDKGGRAGATHVDWLEHCDAVLAQLIGIGDELSRFLTLPTTSRSRHRHTRHGRREAARTIEVAYHLLNSMASQRMTRLLFYSERLKKIGLPSGEASRLRQYERFISSMIEQLRMVKMYRTPQAFRSFARIFTLLLPPFYAPSYAQVAKDINSLPLGICFGLLTALGLTMLFESQQILEDPFTAFLALDGIDVREEFEVLHFAQLVETRKLVFPDAPEYPAGRRAALTSTSRRPTHVGQPPLQSHLYSHHQQYHSNHPPNPRDTYSLASRTVHGGGPDDTGDDKYCTVYSSDDEDEDAHTELGSRIMEEGSTPTYRDTLYDADLASVCTLRTRRYGRHHLKPSAL